MQVQYVDGIEESVVLTIVIVPLSSCTCWPQLEACWFVFLLGCLVGFPPLRCMCTRKRPIVWRTAIQTADHGVQECAVQFMKEDNQDEHTSHHLLKLPVDSQVLSSKGRTHNCDLAHCRNWQSLCASHMPRGGYAWIFGMPLTAPALTASSGQSGCFRAKPIHNQPLDENTIRAIDPVVA